VEKEFEKYEFYKIDKEYLKFLNSKDSEVFYKEDEAYNRKPHLLNCCYDIEYYMKGQTGKYLIKRRIKTGLLVLLIRNFSLKLKKKYKKKSCTRKPEVLQRSFPCGFWTRQIVRIRLSLLSKVLQTPMNRAFGAFCIVPFSSSI